MDEFSLIEQYFTWEQTTSAVDSQSLIAVGIGDDAAVLNIPHNKQLVTSIDTLVSGVHFPENTPADAIGHKALAVNLSDLAAMGAKPAWFTLALTLPEMDHDWLEGFSDGLKKLATQANIALVGGDTTRGSLTISVQVMGLVENNQALLRSGANIGDKIYVTGTLGDAAVGLQSLKGKLSLSRKDKLFCEHRLNYPQPRLAESEIIQTFATSCIDLSDGLLQDLTHVLKASEKGAVLDLSSIPLSKALKSLDNQQALSYASAGGDDYELLFTVPREQEDKFIKNFQQHQFTCIGVVNERLSSIVDAKGNTLTSKGYSHFNDK